MDLSSSVASVIDFRSGSRLKTTKVVDRRFRRSYFDLFQNWTDQDNLFKQKVVMDRKLPATDMFSFIDGARQEIARVCSIGIDLSSGRDETVAAIMMMNEQGTRMLETVRVGYEQSLDAVFKALYANYRKRHARPSGYSWSHWRKICKQLPFPEIRLASQP